jgi:hypothetical protein
MHASLVSTISCAQVLSYMQVYCIVHASTKSYRIMQTSTTGVDIFNFVTLVSSEVELERLVSSGGR